MFMGSFLYKMDNKGRVMIPPQFKQELGKKFIVTRGFENCLFLYSLSEWERISNELSKIPLSSKESRYFLRIWFSSAVEIETDGYSRILIPSNFRKFANLNREIYFIGVYNRIELWDSKNWENYRNSKEISYEDSISKILEGK
ncbi:MAG TPA: division/cell wall cluster transcriptional repressor MraZ [Caldisericia bacterium]|nr:division/cell wall cluster transcriptional repressor MraZ [Caldisericia bacterium]